MKLVRLLSCYTLSLSWSWLHGTLRINLDLHLRQSLFACLSASFCFHKGFQTLVRRFSMRFVFFVASVSQHVSSMLLGWSLSVCLERNECATAIFISAFQGSSNPHQISFRRYDHLCGLLCDQLLTQDVFGGKVSGGVLDVVLHGLRASHPGWLAALEDLVGVYVVLQLTWSKALSYAWQKEDMELATQACLRCLRLDAELYSGSRWSHPT